MLVECSVAQQMRPELLLADQSRARRPSQKRFESSGESQLMTLTRQPESDARSSDLHRTCNLMAYPYSFRTILNSIIS